jgi:NADH-quinone oxidoreductase subunit N
MKAKMVAASAVAVQSMYSGSRAKVALKYAIYGGAASGVMLFGLSLLYGIAGDTSSEVLLGGLDAPVLGTGLMYLVGAVSIASMTYGNLAALNQTSVKRMLAYSSIAHAGYLLMGVATVPAILGGSGDLTGFRAVFFYLVMYLLMNLGAFFVASFVVSRLGSDELPAFRALGKRSPVVAAAMTVFLLALTGIPPTAGFAGKFYLVYAAPDRFANNREQSRTPSRT